MKNIINRIKAIKHGKKFFYCKDLNRVFFAKDKEDAYKKVTGHDVTDNPPINKIIRYLFDF
jgi:hypothetical protein